MNESDYDIWDTVDEFTVLEAAYLALDQSPPEAGWLCINCWEKAMISRLEGGHRIPNYSISRSDLQDIPDSMLFFDGNGIPLNSVPLSKIIHLILNHIGVNLPKNQTTTIISPGKGYHHVHDRFLNIEVSRSQLKNLFAGVTMKPKFLFPEERVDGQEIEELDGRERTTLLRIIRALLKTHNIHLSEKKSSGDNKAFKKSLDETRAQIELGGCTVVQKTIKTLLERILEIDPKYDSQD